MNAFEKRCLKNPRLALTSERLTPERAKEVRIGVGRVLALQGAPVGIVDLCLETPIVGGVRAVELLMPVAQLMLDTLSALAKPLGETEEQQHARRELVQRHCDEMVEALDAIHAHLESMVSSNKAALAEAASGRTV